MVRKVTHFQASCAPKSLPLSTTAEAIRTATATTTKAMSSEVLNDAFVSVLTRRAGAWARVAVAVGVSWVVVSKLDMCVLLHLMQAQMVLDAEAPGAGTNWRSSADARSVVSTRLPDKEPPSGVLLA